MRFNLKICPGHISEKCTLQNNDVMGCSFCKRGNILCLYVLSGLKRRVGKVTHQTITVVSSGRYDVIPLCLAYFSLFSLTLLKVTELSLKTNTFKSCGLKEESGRGSIGLPCAPLPSACSPRLDRGLQSTSLPSPALPGSPPGLSHVDRVHAAQPTSFWQACCPVPDPSSPRG